MKKFWHSYFPKILLAIWILAMLVLAFGCTTNRQILQAVSSLRADFMRIDSLTNVNKALFYYEKSRIDSVYLRISDDDLRKRIDALTRPKSGH